MTNYSSKRRIKSLLSHTHKMLYDIGFARWYFLVIWSVWISCRKHYERDDFCIFFGDLSVFHVILKWFTWFSSVHVWKFNIDSSLTHRNHLITRQSHQKLPWMSATYVAQEFTNSRTRIKATRDETLRLV